MTSSIIGTGSCLPDQIMTNDQLSELVDTSDAWISERTGIRERRIASGISTSALSIQAAEEALKNAGTDPLEIDLIITATITPDNIMPTISCEVQAAIGASNAFCFDLNAACSGFLYAYQTAHAYIASGMAKKVLVIGAETMSRITDWADRTTCILFGDGAGAVVMSAAAEGTLKTVSGSDGSKGSFLTCAGRTLKNPYTQNTEQNPYIKMDGQEVFKFATRKIPEMILELLEGTTYAIDQLQTILLHQANKRILQAAAKRLELDESVFPFNIDKYGNTSAASLPILLDEMNRSGKLIQGKPLILCGFGGGLTWGGVLAIWNQEAADAETTNLTK